MGNTKKISEYKAQAKEQLLGNYGVAVWSFVIIFALFYGLYMVLTGAYNSWNGSAGMTASVMEEVHNITVSAYIREEIAMIIISLVSGSIFAVLNAGYLHILMEISRGGSPKTSEVFYCFKNHPDKAIKIYLPLALIQVVALIPSTILSYFVNKSVEVSGKLFFYYILALVFGFLVYLYFCITFAMAYFVYLDDQEASAFECLRISAKIMKGQKLRYFYILLSLIGYFILSIISLGIGMLYVSAYENMIIINMYKDLLEAKNED